MLLVSMTCFLSQLYQLSNSVSDQMQNVINLLLLEYRLSDYGAIGVHLNPPP